MKKIVLSIWQILYQQILKRKQNLKLGSKVYINKNCEFEGFNYLSSFSEVFDTYFGYASYIGENSRLRKTKIGKYTSIGPDVKTIFGKHPSSIHVSTHPAFFSIRKQVGFTYAKKQLFQEFEPFRDEDNKYSIVIGNDVWIGANVLIMDGIKIGDGVIVAAGSLVVKDIEPYSIVGGVPAKTIKYRFDEEKIKFLLDVKWWEKGENWINKNSSYFTDIDNFIKKYQEDGAN